VLIFLYIAVLLIIPFIDISSLSNGQAEYLVRLNIIFVNVSLSISSSSI